MFFLCSDMMTGQAREEGFISAQFESRAYGDRTGFSHGTKQETEDTGGQAELYTSVTHFLQRGPLSHGVQNLPNSTTSYSQEFKDLVCREHFPSKPKPLTLREYVSVAFVMLGKDLTSFTSEPLPSQGSFQEKLQHARTCPALPVLCSPARH